MTTKRPIPFLACTLGSALLAWPGHASALVPLVTARADVAGPVSTDGLPAGGRATWWLFDRFAQNNAARPRGRAVADHDIVIDSRQKGENRSFSELLTAAQARGRGEYLGVEPDISRNVYRFKFMRSSGNVVWVDVDGRTARVLAERN